MRIKLSELRRMIRRALSEGPAGPGVAANPIEEKGFYPYDLDLKTDIHGYWYMSPARNAGTEGDPGRPDDAKEYIGQTSKTSKQ